MNKVTLKKSDIKHAIKLGRQFHKSHKSSDAKKLIGFVYSAFGGNSFWVSNLVSAIYLREDENGKRLTAREINGILDAFGVEIADDAE